MNYSVKHMHHPCYISDNIRSIMRCLCVLEIIRLKRVSKTWKIIACSILKKRTSEDLTSNPPSNALMGGTLIRDLTYVLPRLQQLTLSLDDFKNIRGPVHLFVLSYICEFRDLVFLRIEKLSWRDLDMAVRNLLPSLENGHPVMNALKVMELPDASIPFSTRLQCMKPLSELTPILQTLTLKCAQDRIIFYLRCFMPHVKNLFILDTLYTTRRFAKVISSSSMLLKHITNDHLDYPPRIPIFMKARNRGSARFSSRPDGFTPLITMQRWVHPNSRRPVSPSYERLTNLVFIKEPLCIEPLGSVKMIESGQELSKGMLRKFASFCALVGSRIIMPPFDNMDVER